MAVKCEMCGKELRTTQGLRGHKTFVHQLTSTSKPPARIATERQLIKLEERVEQLTSKQKAANAEHNATIVKLSSQLKDLLVFVRYQLAKVYDDKDWDYQLFMAHLSANPEVAARRNKNFVAELREASITPETIEEEIAQRREAGELDGYILHMLREWQKKLSEGSYNLPGY